MICESCLEDKEDVSTVFDPFDEDVHGEQNLVDLCDDCYEKIAADI